MTNLQVGWESCAVQQDTFYLHQIYELVNFYKKLHSFIFGWTEWFWQNVLDSWVVESWNISTQNWQNLFFLSTPSTNLWCHAKKIDHLEFVQGVHFEFINSMKNNGTKYLLIFDDSCAETCNSKEFVDIATPGRHRGVSTIYIKHNLLHHVN